METWIIYVIAPIAIALVSWIKEHESERKSGIIQEAFRCKTPSLKCPVLIKLFEFNDQKEDEQRIKKLQSGEYPPECDPIQGGDEEFRPGL